MSKKNAVTVWEFTPTPQVSAALRRAEKTGEARDAIINRALKVYLKAALEGRIKLCV